VTTFTYADLIGATFSTLYVAASWPAFAGFLAFLASHAPATGAAWQALRADLGYVSTTGVPHYVNSAESFPGVACADSDNPTSYQAWHNAAAQEFATYGYFGPIWTWISSICQPWPGGHAGRYTGPWTQQTSAPVLVIGNLSDPATRYEGAVTASQLLPNSRLLTYDGWGHTALLQQPPCVLDAVSAYLVDLTLPAVGTACPATSPFTTGSPSAAARPSGSVAGGDLVPALVPPAVDRVFAN
jgi:pimeloyl-ACP methyl ester carboxylesterase